MKLTTQEPLPDAPLLLTVSSAARLLGISERRLYDIIATKQIPEEVVVRFGRAVRLSRPRLLRWLGAGVEQISGEHTNATA